MVIACWCQREETPERPLSEDDKQRLRFLYEEWAHPFFISMQEFCRLMEARGRAPCTRARPAPCALRRPRPRPRP